MKKKPNQELYVSPQTEMIETNVAQIICQSNTERPIDGIPGWSWS